MNIISYAQSISDIEYLVANNVSEIVVSCVELSRFSKTSFNELVEILNSQKKFKTKITLEWDALYQENNFLFALNIFEKLPLHEISSIRLQDPGTVRYIKEKYDWMKIQLILETGNHNLTGLKRWCEYLGNSAERLILSNELSKEHLECYAKELSIPIEVLVYGRILLFYSPRGLLNPVLDIKSEYIETKGTSEESPHSGFPLIENRHGTFMFNVKDLSLIEHGNEFIEMGISNLRIDNRFDQTMEKMDSIIKKLKHNDSEIKIEGPRPFIKGFYNINKTDVLFVKLKNKRIQRNDINYIGEVIDVEKEHHLCIIVKKEHKNIGELSLKIVTPEGKIKKTTAQTVCNSEKVKVLDLLNESIILIPYVNGVTAKSQVYLDANT